MKCLLAMAVSVVVLSGLSSGQSGEGPGPGEEFLYWDSVREDGTLFGGRLVIPQAADPELADVQPAHVETLWSGLAAGTGSNRYHIVFVGDGYTATQLGTYTNDADSVAAYLLSVEPFNTYADYFVFHRVDVISNESGVDNDPVQGVTRDTALDMAFWCNGIERLLCVDASDALSYANNAPARHQVVALANSSKYGGAGYSGSDLCTCSGHNSSSFEVSAHELGHSMGSLADEYDYGGSATWTAGEPSEANNSTLTSTEMAAADTKWADWLGENNPAFDGFVGTYEGAHYSQFGIYRPTSNSKMRSLGRPFNLPSVERLVREVYRQVSPVDDHADDSLTYTSTDTLWVSTMVPGGVPLEVEWKVNGDMVPGVTVGLLDLSTLGLQSECPYVVTAFVQDPTPWVRDEQIRELWMTETITFTVGAGAPGGADCNQNGFPDSCDLLNGVSFDCDLDGVPDECNWPEDCDGDGVLDSCELADGSEVDLNGNGIPDSCECQTIIFCPASPNSVGSGAQVSLGSSPSFSANPIPLVADGGPPNQPGIFFYGSGPASQAFGEGLRCVAFPLYRLGPPVFFGGLGSASYDLDLTSPPAGFGAGQIQVGSTWRFQLWYRDPPGGPAGFNLSNGLMVTFCI